MSQGPSTQRERMRFIISQRDQESATLDNLLDELEASAVTDFHKLNRWLAHIREANQEFNELTSTVARAAEYKITSYPKPRRGSIRKSKARFQLEKGYDERSVKSQTKKHHES